MQTVKLRHLCEQSKIYAGGVGVDAGDIVAVPVPLADRMLSTGAFADVWAPVEKPPAETPAAKGKKTKKS